MKINIQEAGISPAHLPHSIKWVGMIEAWGGGGHITSCITSETQSVLANILNSGGDSLFLEESFLSGLEIYLYLQKKWMCEFISKSPNDPGPRMSSLSHHYPFNKFLASLVPNSESWLPMLCIDFQEPKQVRCHSKPYQKYERLLLVTLDTKISFLILLCRSCWLKL